MRSPVSIPPRPVDLGLTIRSWAADVLPSRPSPRRAAAAAILAAGTLLLATVLAVVLESDGIGIADASPVYLLAVVAVGSQFGTWAAIGTALIAFLVYDILFTEPRFSVVVSDPREWLDLLLFLFVAIAIGRLVAIQHSRAEEADARALEASSLFAMSRLLATADSADQAAPELARRLAADAGLRRVWITVGDLGRQRTVADTEVGVPIPTTAVLTTLVRTPGDEPARWVHTHEPGRGREPLGGDLQTLRVRIESSSGEASIGTSGVLGTIGAIRDRSSGLPTRAETRILALAADQIALSLRRDQLRRDATDAEIARQGDALKTALIDSVSHDLRTPLASIRATAGGLMDPAVPWSEEPARVAARVIDGEAARLDHLVRAVLDLSRIEAGAVRPELEPHDLRDLLEPIVARARAAAPGRTIEASLPDSLPAVLVDPVLLDIILGNVLDNAIAHAPSAPVQISAERTDDDRVRLVVQDGGPGVPRGALPHLFDRFYRVPGGLGSARKGLGIGLSIVHGLSEAMGGTVGASDSPLGGLAISLTVRVADVPAEEPDR